ERPPSESVKSARQWLASLPLAVEKGAPATPPEGGSRMRINARNLEALADAWERRPPEITYLGNARMRELLMGGAAEPRVRVTGSGMDWFSVRADWEAEGHQL